MGVSHALGKCDLILMIFGKPLVWIGSNGLDPSSIFLVGHFDTNVDLGQRGHSLNGSGYGSWPYIVSFEFSSSMDVDYGTDSIEVEFGSKIGRAHV